MPEGDSVWRAARRLNRGLQGHRLARTDFRVPQHATADLSGTTVLGTAAHGKHMLTRLDNGVTLHTHFRMDGSWTVLAPGRSLPRHLQPDVRVVLVSERGPRAYALSVPVVELVPTRDEDSVVGHLGPDPLRPDWDPEEAVRRLGADPTRPAVAALLDQRLLAGLGNLWANELLFVRGHNPWTPIGEVDLPALVAAAQRMLRQSIQVRGNGQVTTGDPRPGHDHWVYGRVGQPCRRCGTRIRVEAEVAGDAERRRTWWCPSCQPGPGGRPPGRP
ncbi:MAG TPA: DNA-formamidopyrimidine glycosylase family protein [Nocardioidaceae bacterium]|nr:DNA-formamidopyrimidine glycosylase family protein [Nocardioidaceae bacterium]